MDELPQIFDVVIWRYEFCWNKTRGNEVCRKSIQTEYDELHYCLPAGITSEASIQYKDEAELLDAADDVDKVYVEKVLPEKMKYNLESIRKFGFWREIGTMVKTVVAVVR